MVSGLPGPAAVSLLQRQLWPAAAVPAVLPMPFVFEPELHEHQLPPWPLRGSCLHPQEKPYRQLGKPCRQLAKPCLPGTLGRHSRAWGIAC